MEAYDIVAIKTTGEKVILIRQWELDCGWEVRRPTIDDEGKIEHVTQTFRPEELETVEENINRQIDEMLLKNKLQQRLYEGSKTAQPASDPTIN